MTVGTLGFHTSTGSGTNIVYTVPTGKKAEVSVSVFNKDNSSKTITLFIAKADSPLSSEIIHLETLTSVSNGFERTGLILDQGDRVIYTTTSSNTAVHVRGIETDTSSSVVSVSPSAITTNTTTEIYQASSDCVINFGLSVTSSGSTDTASVEVYVSKTNVASGVLLHRDLLTSYFTGFERTAVALSSGDKLLVVTTGIIGSVSSRIHGFKVI